MRSTLLLVAAASRQPPLAHSCHYLSRPTATTVSPGTYPASTAMLEKHQLVSRLLQELPQLRTGWDDPWRPSTNLGAYAYAICVTDLYEHGDHIRVHAAFDQLEEFLREGTEEVRNLVGCLLEALQTVAAWQPYGVEVFARFLSPATGRVWHSLDATRTASLDLDLPDCSVLEAEIVRWRLVRHKLRLLAADCPAH